MNFHDPSNALDKKIYRALLCLQLFAKTTSGFIQDLKFLTYSIHPLWFWEGMFFLLVRMEFWFVSNNF